MEKVKFFAKQKIKKEIRKNRSLKMLKETIICIVIIIAIIFGDKTTANFTTESVSELSSELGSLREKLTQDNPSKQELQEKMEEIYQNWEQKHDKLAYYIEHDELEKVETDFVTIKSYIETEEFEEATSELDKSVFVLKHIEDKYDFNLQNVF